MRPFMSDILGADFPHFVEQKQHEGHLPTLPNPLLVSAGPVTPGGIPRERLADLDMLDDPVMRQRCFFKWVYAYFGATSELRKLCGPKMTFCAFNDPAIAAAEVGYNHIWDNYVPLTPNHATVVWWRRFNCLLLYHKKGRLDGGKDTNMADTVWKSTLDAYSDWVTGFNKGNLGEACQVAHGKLQKLWDNKPPLSAWDRPKCLLQASQTKTRQSVKVIKAFTWGPAPPPENGPGPYSPNWSDPYFYFYGVRGNFNGQTGQLEMPQGPLVEQETFIVAVPLKNLTPWYVARYFNI